MSSTKPDPTPAPLPLRHRNPPINAAARPSRASLTTLGVIVLGYVIGIGAPSLVVSPMDPSASISRVALAFAFTLLGVTISMVAGMRAFRRDRNWSWLIITGVPAITLFAGGAILAATKMIS